MTSLDALVPEITNWATAEDDSKDQGNAPTYHDDTGDDWDDRECSDWEDPMVEEKQRKFCCRDGTSKGDLGCPIGLSFS